VIRIDVYVHGRPQLTLDVSVGAITAVVKAGTGASIRLEGFAAGALVAVRKHQIA
jgi:hypothetical protein